MPAPMRPIHAIATDEDKEARGPVRRSVSLREALADQLALTPEWRKTFMGTPRHWFLPPVFWGELDGERHHRFDRRQDPDAWLEAAYRDSYAVFQWDEGRQHEPDHRYVATSSASRPSVVLRNAADLELEDGNSVLVLGSGSGWFDALLRSHLASGSVTSVDVDAAVSALAASHARRAGLDIAYRVGDGAFGWRAHAPYDRIASAYAVGRVPAAWLGQMQPHGLITAPWAGSWVSWGMLKVRTASDGSAQGRFLPYGAFARSRDVAAELAGDFRGPEVSGWHDRATELDLWDVLRRNDERFAMDAFLPGVRCVRDQTGDDSAAERMWLFTADRSSMAAVNREAGDQTRFTVRHIGPRDLVAEVERVHAWFEVTDRPTLDRYGLSVRPDGGQRMWLDSPDRPLPRIRGNRRRRSSLL